MPDNEAWRLSHSVAFEIGLVFAVIIQSPTLILRELGVSDKVCFGMGTADVILHSSEFVCAGKKDTQQELFDK